MFFALIFLIVLSVFFFIASSKIGSMGLLLGLFTAAIALTLASKEFGISPETIFFSAVILIVIASIALPLLAPEEYRKMKEEEKHRKLLRRAKK